MGRERRGAPLLPTAAAGGRGGGGGAGGGAPGRLEGAVLTLLVLGGIFMLTLSASLVAGLAGEAGAGGLLDGGFHGELLAAAGAVEGAAGAGYPAHTAWAAARAASGAGRPPPPGAGTCEDLHSECANWAGAGHCTGENSLYMLGDPAKGFPPQCPRSCGLCGSVKGAGAGAGAARGGAAEAGTGAGAGVPSLYRDIPGGVRTMDWKPFDLGSLAGRATLVVNAASG